MASERMTLRLTVRPADRDGMSQTAKALEEGGIDVISTGPTALTLSAPPTVISRFFDAPVDTGGHGPRFSRDPTYDRLPGKYSYSIYFPTKPTYF